MTESSTVSKHNNHEIVVPDAHGLEAEAEATGIISQALNHTKGTAFTIKVLATGGRPHGIRKLAGALFHASVKQCLGLLPLWYPGSWTLGVGRSPYKTCSDVPD